MYRLERDCIWMECDWKWRCNLKIGEIIILKDGEIHKLKCNVTDREIETDRTDRWQNQWWQRTNHGWSESHAVPMNGGRSRHVQHPVQNNANKTSTKKKGTSIKAFVSMGVCSLDIVGRGTKKRKGKKKTMHQERSVGNLFNTKRHLYFVWYIAR